MEEYIQLKDENVLKFGIKNANGEPTGEYLEFDLEDIELPLKYQELVEKDKKNRNLLKTKFLVIDKKEDHKREKLFSSNEEEKLKALNVFFKAEEEVYDMFLGKGAVRKLLNGRKFRWTTLQEIDEIIEKVIVPKLDLTMDKIEKKIQEKYSNKKEDNTLE